MRVIITVLNVLSRLLVLEYLGVPVGLALAGFFHDDAMTTAFLAPVIGLPVLQILVWFIRASREVRETTGPEVEMSGGWEEWQTV